MRGKWGGRDRGRSAGWLLLLLSACGRFDLDFGSDGTEVTRPEARPQLWTMFDIHQALVHKRPVAPTASFPAGFPAETFLSPQPDGTVNLRIIPAYSEGEPAAYVLPEMWLNFDEIWVQPWYEFVTAWDDRSNAQNALKGPNGEDSPPVFDVGPRSLFYSPFWVLFYAVVPPGTAFDHYTSVEQIVNDGLPIYRGAPWIFSVRPPEVTLAAKPVHPYLNKEVATFLRQYDVSWVDDQAMPYFDEGFNNFKYDGRLVVEETPLFFLAKRDASGKPALLDAPAVIGTGPLFSRRAPEVGGGKPRFGSASRFHIAMVPATAQAFDPDQQVAATQALVAKGIDPQTYRGRVARNAVKIAERDKPCFEAMDFPTSCTWLDSQARIEDAGGASSIRRTEVVACSPVVFYGGKGIGR